MERHEHREPDDEADEQGSERKSAGHAMVAQPCIERHEAQRKHGQKDGRDQRQCRAPRTTAIAASISTILSLEALQRVERIIDASRRIELQDCEGSRVHLHVISPAEHGG